MRRCVRSGGPSGKTDRNKKVLPRREFSRQLHNRRQITVTVVEAIIEGIIQGATEFLPVSSSGHLSLSKHFCNTIPFIKHHSCSITIHQLRQQGSRLIELVRVDEELPHLLKTPQYSTHCERMNNHETPLQIRSKNSFNKQPSNSHFLSRLFIPSHFMGYSIIVTR